MNHIENSDEEIEYITNNLNIGVFMTNYYFDSSDYSNPVKVDIDNSNEFATINGFKRQARFKIQRSIVSDTTSYLPFASTDQITYFSLGASYRDFSYNPNDNIAKLILIFMKNIWLINQFKYNLKKFTY